LVQILLSIISFFIYLELGNIGICEVPNHMQNFQFIKFVFMEKALSLTFDQIFHDKANNIIRNEMQHANQCQLCNFHNITCNKIDRLVNEHLSSQRACIHFPINFNHRHPKGLCSLSLGAPYLFTNLHFTNRGGGIVQLLVNTYLSMCN
jgi:hypothetical protein